MKIIFLAFLLIALVDANLQIQQALENGLHPFSDKMIFLINNANLTWKAKKHFSEDELEDVKIKLGTILDPNVPKKYDQQFYNVSDIPENFDTREKWLECKDIIDDIRDQGNCGSCWAFAAVGSMSDRTCIASGGKQKVKISADDLLSCCTISDSLFFCGYGCNGGFPPIAYKYWVHKGIVTGGNYNDTTSCRPYEIKPCGHHTTKRTPCEGNHRTPGCKRECVNGADYQKDKHFGLKEYSVHNKVEDIQKEIMTYGSVSASLKVYSDFPLYEKGVYIATSKSLLGGHAVRIIGWGTENNTPYWLVANSWNVDWGSNGYFKILRGQNHCGIEESIIAGIAKI